MFAVSEWIGLNGDWSSPGKAGGIEEEFGTAGQYLSLGWPARDQPRTLAAKRTKKETCKIPAVRRFARPENHHSGARLPVRAERLRRGPACGASIRVRRGKAAARADRRSAGRGSADAGDQFRGFEYRDLDALDEMPL